LTARSIGAVTQLEEASMSILFLIPAAFVAVVVALLIADQREATRIDPLHDLEDAPVEVPAPEDERESSAA
jgi:hypothetical protein